MVHELASVYEMTTKWLGHLSTTGPADARALSLRVCVVISVCNNPCIEQNASVQATGVGILTYLFL